VFRLFRGWQPRKFSKRLTVVKGILLAQLEIGHIDARFLIWDSEGLWSVFMGSSLGYGFHLDLTPIAIDRFRLFNNWALDFLCTVA
jgi:hypothetical protein